MTLKIFYPSFVQCMHFFHITHSFSCIIPFFQRFNFIFSLKAYWHLTQFSVFSTSYFYIILSYSSNFSCSIYAIFIFYSKWWSILILYWLLKYSVLLLCCSGRKSLMQCAFFRKKGYCTREFTFSYLQLRMIIVCNANGDTET